MKIGSLKINPVQIGIIIFTVITAVIHIFLGKPLFILNGLGYFALLVVYFLPNPLAQRWHPLVRWLFAGYILLIIILYFVFHPNGTWQDDGLGLATKMVEVILLLLLMLDGQRSSVEETESS